MILQITTSQYRDQLPQSVNHAPPGLIPKPPVPLPVKSVKSGSIALAVLVLCRVDTAL